MPRQIWLALHPPHTAFYYLSSLPISLPHILSNPNALLSASLLLFFFHLHHFWLQPHQWRLIRTRPKEGIPIPSFSMSSRPSANRSTKTTSPLREEQPRLPFLGALFLLFLLLKMWASLETTTGSTGPSPDGCLCRRGVLDPSSTMRINRKRNQAGYLRVSRRQGSWMKRRRRRRGFGIGSRFELSPSSECTR